MEVVRGHDRREAGLFGGLCESEKCPRRELLVGGVEADTGHEDSYAIGGSLVRVGVDAVQGCKLVNSITRSLQFAEAMDRGRMVTRIAPIRLRRH
jgi:hypothetical protein